MQAIRNTLELVRTRMAGLPASAKLLAGSLVVILALGLFLVAQWSGKTESVAFAITPTAYDEARQFLVTRNVSFEEQGGKLMVPSSDHADLLASFVAQGGGSEVAWDQLVPSDPFATESERKQRYMLAVQTVLSKVIGGFKNVKSAMVIISPKPSSPLGAARNTQTASVTVTMRTGGLTQEQVDAIASMVAGTQSGMKPESVSVTDGMQAYRTSFGRSAATGENLEQSLKVADAVQARIATVLSWLPGVRIAVNAQVVTTERTSTTTEFKEGVVAPISEVSSTSETKGATPQREPGVVPNTGLSLGNAAAGGGSQSAIERNENKYRAEIPGTRRTEIDPTGYAAKIDASIAVPWSYFEQVWRMKNPAAEGAEQKKPDIAAIETIRDDELARIRKVVEPLISTDVVEGSKRGVVEVTWFPDLAPPAQQASMAAGLGELVLGGGGGTIGGNGLIKPIGLGILAIASLFFMFNIAKKASVRENLPSAEELAGVPPKLESDDAEIVGEADEATPALEGMELDDDSLRRAQMLEQLNEMASRDPAEIAGVLRRWMRATT